MYIMKMRHSGSQTKAMAELFGVKSQAISKHLGNIYEEEELTREATCSKKEQVQIEGGREVKRNLDFYNLDLLLHRLCLL